MPDISLDFGLLIAYFIPGIITMIGLAFIFQEIAALLSKLKSGEASVGLFVIVSAFAIIIGMVVSVVRADIIDTSFAVKVPYLDAPHYQSLERMDPEYDKLTNEGKLKAYHEAKENEKRPYQFYGNILLAFLMLLIGWCASSARRKHQITKRAAIAVAAALITILILYPASRKSYYRYIEAVKALNKIENGKG